jgi:hypothetical protein
VYHFDYEYESIIATENIFKSTENFLIGKNLTVIGNQFPETFKNSDIALFVVGESAVLLGNQASNPKALIKRFLVNSADAGNLLGFSTGVLLSPKVFWDFNKDGKVIDQEQENSNELKIKVFALPERTWNCKSNSNWIYITQGSSGRGNGEIIIKVDTFMIAPTLRLRTPQPQPPTPRRDGAISINGEKDSISIRQWGEYYYYSSIGPRGIGLDLL